MKNKIITANWKSNGDTNSLHNLLIPIIDFIKKKESMLKLIVVPPFVYLNQVHNIIINTNIMLGAQNVDIHSNGAFTGEISVDMLKDVHVCYVIIGHSERKIYHKESDLLISKKIQIVQNAKLIPIFCIGETEQDYKNGITNQICQKQIDSVFNVIGEKAFNNMIIAYEPVWAIGSGRTPSIDFIQDTCGHITNYILNIQNVKKKSFFIQYGGSVNESNIEKLSKVIEIDGFLIGSASLFISRFLKILTKYS